MIGWSALLIAWPLVVIEIERLSVVVGWLSLVVELALYPSWLSSLASRLSSLPPWLSGPPL